MTTRHRPKIDVTLDPGLLRRLDRAVAQRRAGLLGPRVSRSVLVELAVDEWLNAQPVGLDGTDPDDDE